MKIIQAKTALIFSTAIIFIISPLISLMVIGVFSWHIKQPAAWQGGLELLALSTCVYAALKFLWGIKRWTVISGLLFIYARHQAVDLPIIVVFLYIESIIALGWHLLPMVGYSRDQRYPTLIVSAVLGTVGWSLCIWISSITGFGTVLELRWLAFAILGAALITSKGTSLARQITDQIDSSGKKGIAFHALTIAMFMLLFAKAAVSTDYDSMWYGLSGDNVLAGASNLFSSEGLVAPVHYYPKLYEALLLPLTGIGSITAIFGLSIFGWVLVLSTVYVILQETGVRRNLRPAIVALIATLPALANISITAKGDAFSAWLLCVSIYALLKFRSSSDPRWFWLCLTTILVGVQVRLSAIPYGGTLLIILAATAISTLRNHGLTWIKHLARSKATIAFAACLILTGLVTLRTMNLAGIPLIAPDQAVKIASLFGLDLHFPVGRLPVSASQHLPTASTLFFYIFDPKKYPHLELYWTGNFWIFLPLVAVIYGARRNSTIVRAWPLLLVGLSFFVVLLGYKFDESSGADGNYFIVPLIYLGLFGAVMVQNTTRRYRIESGIVTGSLLIFALSSATICLVTGSWGPGTRGWDFVMTRNPLDFTQRQTDGLQNAHLSGVASHLVTPTPSARVVGVAPAPDAWWLPTRYEPIDIISWSRPDFVVSATSLRTYLQADSIGNVILRAPDAPEDFKTINSPVLAGAIASMEQEHLAKKVYSNGYYDLWKLHLHFTFDMPVLEDGSYLRIHLIGSPKCGTMVPFEVTADWHIQNPQQDSIKIYVEAASSKEPSLWAQTGATGAQTTGRWILPGSKFFIRSPVDNKLILSNTVMPECTLDK